MSNDVYGYIVPALTTTARVQLQKYIKACTLNIQTITTGQLFNFPLKLIPEEIVFAFDIADGPNSINATYLIDYNEYDPENSSIGFPPGAKDRLNLLLDVLSDMFSITNAQKMVVALTECNQIEIIKKIKFSELYDVIHADFEVYQGPPDTLYEITA